MLKTPSMRRTLPALVLFGTGVALSACGSDHARTSDENPPASGGSAGAHVGSGGVAQSGNEGTAGTEAGGRGGTGGSHASGGGDTSGGAGTPPLAGSGGTTGESGHGGEAASSEGGEANVVDCSGSFGDEHELVAPVMNLVLSSPTVPADELELFFAQRSAIDSVRHVMRATRTTRDADFGDAAVVPELESVCADDEDRALSITADGLRLYVGCSTGTGMVKPGLLHLARRSSRDAAFVIDAETYGTVGPSVDVTADELTAFSTSDTYVQDPPRSYVRAARDQAFGDAQPILGLEATSLGSPSLASDGLTLFGGVSPDLVVTTRSAEGKAFGAPSIVLQGDDLRVYGSPEASADCRSLYFVRVDTMGASGSLLPLYGIRVVER
jgi:hypothetical protein